MRCCSIEIKNNGVCILIVMLPYLLQVAFISKANRMFEVQRLFKVDFSYTRNCALQTFLCMIEFFLLSAYGR